MKTEPQYDHKAWAQKIIDRIEAGERVPYIAEKMAREVVAEMAAESSVAEPAVLARQERSSA